MNWSVAWPTARPNWSGPTPRCFESERRLRLALRAGHTGVWDWDFATDRLTWSEESYAIHAMQPGSFDATIESFKQLVHEADRERCSRTSLPRSIRPRPTLASSASSGPTARVRWVTNLGVVQRDAAGRPASMTGTITDITERHACARKP